jgi:hypothetical protein
MAVTSVAAGRGAAARTRNGKKAAWEPVSGGQTVIDENDDTTIRRAFQRKAREVARSGEKGRSGMAALTRGLFMTNEDERFQ